MATRNKNPIRVFIVDDHPIVRQGLTQLIGQEPDLEVCGEAEDAAQALAAMDKARPTVVLVDISLKGVSGLELVKRMRERLPDVAPLVISMHDEAHYAERILRAGARGYIMKSEPPEKVVQAIRRVSKGEIYVSDRVAAIIVKKSVGAGARAGESPMERLTDREFEVFELIGQGRSTRQIADRLHLSVKTIESHREHIKDKLGLDNATQLLAHAIQWLMQDGDAR